MHGSRWILFCPLVSFWDLLCFWQIHFWLSSHFHWCQAISHPSHLHCYSSRLLKEYNSAEPGLRQKVTHSSFLVDHSRRVMYCWNHKVRRWQEVEVLISCMWKVASSFWMWLFTKMGTGEQPEVKSKQLQKLWAKLLQIIWTKVLQILANTSIQLPPWF